MLLLPLLLTACQPWTTSQPIDGVRQVSGSFRSNGKGLAKMRLPIEAEDDAFLLTASTDSPNQVYTDRVVGSEGTLFSAPDWWDSPFIATSGAFPTSVMTFSWPWNERSVLSEGPYRILLGTVDSQEAYLGGIDVDVDILIKDDPDLTSGTLAVTIFYAGDTSEDAEIITATEEAVERWEEIYAEIGISLEVTYTGWSLGNLDPPGWGSAAEYEAISAASGPRSVNIVIAPTIELWDEIYGIAGDIPGPLTATARSAILLSVEVSWGADARFSQGEVKLLGETMAHETGHFLGVFHPVEITWNEWDALDDTPICDSETNCLGEMADHLMFPFPLCGALTCDPQFKVTEDQTAVLHRSVAVD
jgi:hypothetical protein